MQLTDPVALAQALVQAPSVTPDPGDAIGLVADWLAELGFEVRSVPGEDGPYPVPNLIATLPGGGPILAFNGHTDVVPPGDANAWSRPPFAGEIVDRRLWGRGACDMKGGIAAWIAASARRIERGDGGRLQTLITGDEEGVSVAGTKRIVEVLRAGGPAPSACIVGEPTSAAKVGDRLKVGRRGSMNAEIVVRGVQGHSAYPEFADNPCHRLVRILSALTARALDEGTSDFQPTSLQVTSIDVGNPATNVIPATASAKLNVRFNTEHKSADLIRWIEETVARDAPQAEVTTRVSGEAFLAGRGWFADLVVAAVEPLTGSKLALDTGGGTSDARFMKDLCPVVELGTVGHSLHATDEYVALAELERLTDLYGAVMDRFFREV